MDPTHVLEYQLIKDADNKYLRPNADGCFYLPCPDDFSLAAFSYSEMTSEDYTEKMMQSAGRAAMLLLALPRNA